jgi:hypothetical protein
VPRRSGQRPARWSLLEGTQAAAVLGYHARYTWQAVLDTAPEQDDAKQAGP